MILDGMPRRNTALARASIVVMALSGVCSVLLFAGSRLPQPVVSFASDVMYQVVSAGAAVVLILAARRLEGRERVAWLAIGIGAASFGVGDLVWISYDLGGGTVPYPGPPDVFYLFTYLLWFFGVLAMPYAHGSRFRQARLALDALVGTIALAGVTWILGFADLLHFQGDDRLEVVVSAAYPLFDALLVASLVVLALRRQRGGGLRVVALTLGMASTALADLIYLGAFETYVAGAWYEGMWVLGYGLAALAAFDLLRPPAPDQPAINDHPSQSKFSYVVFAALLVASAVVVATDPGIDPTSKALLVVTGAVAVAVVIRVSLGIAENRFVVERERGEMIASVSHELRTPLTAIQGFIDLMVDDEFPMDDGERAAMLATVQGQTRGLARIVSDLIEVSRDQLTSDRLDPTEFDLAGAVDDAVSASAVPADVTVSVAECTVVADRQRLVQVIVNLVTNAARYGDGTIHIVAHTRDLHVVIEVHDGGPGVPDRYRELIWERFERGAHRTNSIPGTGIGLALVRALVEAHGGQVAYVRSAILGGACFVVTLPISARPPTRQLTRAGS